MICRLVHIKNYPITSQIDWFTQALVHTDNSYSHVAGLVHMKNGQSHTANLLIDMKNSQPLLVHYIGQEFLTA